MRINMIWVCFTLTVCMLPDTGCRMIEEANYDADAEPDAGAADSDANTDTDTDDEGTPTVYTVDGFVQKGPYIMGSQMDIQELNNTFAPTGTTYNTQTIDDLGSFELTSEIGSRFVEIKATGFYFNEVTNELSSANLITNVLADLVETSEININLLTTLERPRIKHLVINEGMTFSDARAQAETELLTIFNISEGDLSIFQEMDITEAGKSNAVLLAISVILLADNTVGDLASIISSIANDLEEDGVVDGQVAINKILENAIYIGERLENIRSNIEEYFLSKGITAVVPGFEDFCDNDGDTIINKYDFTIDFSPVESADLNAEVLSQKKTVVLPPNCPEAIATVVGGTGVLVVNDVDSGTEAKVYNGDTLQIKQTASKAYSTTVATETSVTYLDEQEVSGSFSVTTRSYPYFTLVFDEVTNADLNAEYTSNIQSVTLPDSISKTMATITSGDGVLIVNSIDSGPETTVENGDILQIKQVAGNGYNASVTTDVSVTYLGENIASGSFSIATTYIKFTQATSDPDFGVRSFHSSVVFDDKMWMIGGGTDVWHSEDGVTWIQATADAGFGSRVEHTSLVFNNKMWVIGGVVEDDVWYSENGATWVQATTDAGFTLGHTSIVFDNKMWAIGGEGTNVLYSEDGVTWIQATPDAGFGSRDLSTCVVFDNKMWVTGGMDINNSVWYSEDGVTWIQATADAKFGSRTEHTSLVFDNKIWVIGGNCHNSNINCTDVWYSKDGITWTQAAIDAGFGSLNGHTSVVFDNKMWVIGGRGDIGSGVWYSTN
ncbi:MAG: hypothetical protein GY847_27445 [Proteobacteria bacterium]|nr:hypothetical protein [Pseudomonadota bacterium]